MKLSTRVDRYTGETNLTVYLFPYLPQGVGVSLGVSTLCVSVDVSEGVGVAEGVRVNVGVMVGVSLGVGVGVRVTTGSGIGSVKSTSNKVPLTQPPTSCLI